jgi:SAM-dependent methyltransferase
MKTTQRGRGVVTLAAAWAVSFAGAGFSPAQDVPRQHPGHAATQEEHHHHQPDADPERQREREEANREYDVEWAQWQKELFGLPIRPGMTVADVGAGDGTLALHLASAVGDQGHVYANEIESGKVEAIQQHSAEAGAGNVTVILGAEEDPRLPPGEVDLVVMVEVFHHLTRPRAFLATLARQVAPGASLVLVEPDVSQKDGPLDKGCYSDPEGTRKLAEQVGWRFEAVRSHTVRDFRFFVLTLSGPAVGS